MVTSGGWVRKGATIVLDLGPSTPARGWLEREMESSQPTLRQGSQGSAVRTLQSRLKALRFDPGPIDGQFGSLTGSAVRAFQSARRLQVDGIVGPLTWAALYATTAPKPSPTQPWPATAGSRRAVHLTVPFIGYDSNDKDGCFLRCTEMAAAVGVRVGGPDVRIQVATREDTLGRITIDPAKAREGIAYIDSRLDAGDPVVVGVSYMDSDYNVDDITDHFVIITTRGTDQESELYYAFHDPATRHLWKGGDQNVANRFYVAPGGGLFCPAPAAVPIPGRIYDVAMVRRNL